MSIKAGIAIIRTDKLHYRIRMQMKGAGIAEHAFANFRSSPRVQKKFHLIAPHALEVLDKDPRLLEWLEDCFKRSRELSPELVGTLRVKKLEVTPFGKPPFFYGVRHADEQKAYRDQVEDYTNNPDLQDIALILEVEGIELNIPMAVMSNLGVARIKSLHYVLDPRRSDLSSFIRRKRVERVAIVFSNAEEVAVKPDGRDGKNTIYIPIDDLNTANFLDVKIISALRAAK